MEATSVLPTNHEPPPSNSTGGGGAAGRGSGRGRSRGSRGRGRGSTRPTSVGTATASASTSNEAQPTAPARSRSQHHQHQHQHPHPRDGDQPTPQPAAAPAPKESRRSRFNAQLTNGSPSSSAGAGPSHLRPTSTAFTPPSASGTTTPNNPSASLREKLAQELSSGSYDCSICFSTLSRVAAIHSCSTCFAPVHLACIRKWGQHAIASSLERVPPPPNGEGTWRCPSCQTSFGASALPTVYKCFCGRVDNPAPVKGGGNVPHSCGGQCERKRPDGCKHPCGINCHPGPCPPCGILVERVCGCGKDKLVLRCSAVTASTGISCGRKCGKKLGCGMHECETECHEGDCGECEDVREKKCFCGREVREELCKLGSSRERTECAAPASTSGEGEAGGSWMGEYSCKAVCEAPYSCLIHKCESPCHPHSSTSTLLPCPFSPELLTHCPCSSTPLSFLLKTPRTSCTSPIPTCGAPCRKPLKSCGHLCSSPCHKGDCPPCGEELIKVCRCGSLRKAVICGNTRGRTEDEDEMLCEKPCRAMRACGRHQCSRKCCPLSFQEALTRQKKGKKRFGNEDDGALEDPEGWHECEIVCGKKLPCGVHFCERKDHKGGCGNCLNASFEELICHCGSTVLLPPIPCNTTIDCRFPCIRPPTCRLHPQMSHACHEDPDGCPPCPFLTAKRCACEKKFVSNVRCGGAEGSVRCGTICGKLLRCAFHRCRKPCHPAGQCESCDQTCLKPRHLCLHPCPDPCHFPSSCSIETPCPKFIEITCLCGNLTEKKRCGTCEERPEGNREKMLKCTDACETKKRNERLKEALGVIERDRTKREVEYDSQLLSYYAANVAWASAIETALTEFVALDKPSMHFPSMKQAQRQFAHELAEKFELRSESLDVEPHRSVVVHRQSNSSIPTPTLAEALAAQPKPSSSSASLNFASLKKALPTRVPNNSLFLEGVLGFESDTLKDMLRPHMTGFAFDITWIGDEDVLVTFRGVAMTESRLSSIATSVRHLIEDTGFCVVVEPVARTEDGRVNRGNWTPVNSLSTGGSGKGFGTSKASGWSGTTSNTFSALGGQSSSPWGTSSSEFVPPPTSNVKPNLPPPRLVAAALQEQRTSTPPPPSEPTISVEDPASIKFRSEPIPDSWDEVEEE